jgi:5-methylcytosine-specific restriction endonuclease McrA
VTAATDVDHILDRRPHPELALDRDNLQPLCRRCHNAKRADRR